MKARSFLSIIVSAVLLTACGSQPAIEQFNVPKSSHSQQCYLSQAESYFWLEQEDEWLTLPESFRQQFEQDEINWLAENIFIVSMGQKPSAGYGLQLSGWLLEQDHWQVTRMLHVPAAGTMQAMMMSSPCVMVKIPKAIKSFNLLGEKGQVLGRWPY